MRPAPFGPSAQGDFHKVTLAPTRESEHSWLISFNETFLKNRNPKDALIDTRRTQHLYCEMI